MKIFYNFSKTFFYSIILFLSLFLIWSLIWIEFWRQIIFFIFIFSFISSIIAINKEKSINIFLLYFFIILCFFWIFYFIWDISSDWNTYHLYSILKILEWKNIIYDSFWPHCVQKFPPVVAAPQLGQNLAVWLFEDEDSWLELFWDEVWLTFFAIFDLTK